MRDAALAAWPDRAVPELGGRSPREAARGDARRRAQVETLLAEIEYDQWRLRTKDRYDFGELRCRTQLES